jgi:hypothetical protein
VIDERPRGMRGTELTFADGDELPEVVVTATRPAAYPSPAQILAAAIGAALLFLVMEEAPKPRRRKKRNAAR